MSHAIQAKSQKSRFHLEWSLDSDIATQTMRHPAVYPYISDDTCPNPSDFSMPPVDGVEILSVLCYNYETYCGCFILFNKGSDTFEIHTCLLPIARGMGKIFGDAVVSKIFKETDCKVITTYAPETNPLAKRLALKCGFEFCGYGEPIILNGEPVKVSLFSLRR